MEEFSTSTLVPRCSCGTRLEIRAAPTNRWDTQLVRSHDVLRRRGLNSQMVGTSCILDERGPSTRLGGRMWLSHRGVRAMRAWLCFAISLDNLTDERMGW